MAKAVYKKYNNGLVPASSTVCTGCNGAGEAYNANCNAFRCGVGFAHPTNDYQSFTCSNCGTRGNFKNIAYGTCRYCDGSGYKGGWKEGRGTLIGQVTLDYGSVSTTSKNPDGYWYTLVKQLSPPSAPAFILLPDKIQGGSPCAVSWGAASDTDGDLSGYQLERSTNGGAYAQIYKGSGTSYSDPVAYGLSSVRYRVCAYDAQGQYGPYKESDLHTVINNIAPEITGEDTDLGVKTEGFSYIYSVSNAEAGEAVIVAVTLDNEEQERFQAVMGQEYMADLTGERWTTVLNGEHTLSIQAVDAAGERCQRNITFTKNVSRLRFQLSEPLPSEAAAYKTVVNLMAVIPPGALLTVELCNNGYDKEPAWEDVSNSVKLGNKYFFQNTTKTAERWGYNIRVTLDRNGAAGDCYVENAGGAFEYGTV